MLKITLGNELTFITSLLTVKVDIPCSYSKFLCIQSNFSKQMQLENYTKQDNRSLSSKKLQQHDGVSFQLKNMFPMSLNAN